MIAPFAGVLIDRLGPRRMLSFGCILLSIGYVLYGRLNSLGMLYAIHVILALVGTSLGSIVLSPVNALLIERFGWRQAFLMEAALPIALMVVILAVVKNPPRDIGSVAMGLDETAGRDLRQEGLTLGEAMRTRTFRAIGLSGMMIYYSILALYNHVVLHLRGLGFEPLNAGFALSLLGLLGLTGKLLIGVAGLATLRKDLVLPAIAIVGLGWGGLFTLYNLLAVTNFGLRSAARSAA